MKRPSLPPCLLSILLMISAIIIPTHLRGNSVVDSVHNLSVSGTGTVKASNEREVCVFCHTPHRAAELPLWNHTMSNASYVVYSSTTMRATVGQPTGASKLCLSCHDGTVALGSVHSKSSPIAMQGGVTTMPSGPGHTANLGTDLSHDHPISFTYDSHLYQDSLTDNTDQLRDPATLTGPVRLDENKQMQCTACHNPHDNQYPNFLVMDNTNSALCSTCHSDSLWSSSAHGMSTVPITPLAAAALATQTSSSTSGKRTVPKAPVQKAPKTVAANGCNNCHDSHGASSRARLLTQTREEQTCFKCHNGNVGRQNLEAEFNKLSVHPVLQTSNLHDPRENLSNAPRHVACADCHNSHVAKKPSARLTKNTAVAIPAASGPILGVRGVNRNGASVNSVAYEYELCFRCHGDSLGNKLPTVNRITPEPNTRRQFAPANASFHPVISAGRNSNVPSLIPPYNSVSTVQCTDCHNNDQGPGAGGTGPSGPHGSAFAPLLERRLVTADQTIESAANYALCYKCHSRDSILNDQSFRAFSSSGKGDRGHRFHIVDQKTSCTTCHDSHGVAANKNLINFNRDYVTAASNGRLEYRSTGPFRGNCTLTCHGYEHVGTSYPESFNSLVPSAVHIKH